MHKQFDSEEEATLGFLHSLTRSTFQETCKRLANEKFDLIQELTVEKQKIRELAEELELEGLTLLSRLSSSHSS